jgi:serine protease AprX
MLETNPSLNPSQIKDILQRTATPLPPYYRHEVGAGMLNVHAAVLESAFPARKMGVFRSILDRQSVRFTTSTLQSFNGTAFPGSSFAADIQFPSDTVQASVSIGWGSIFSANDLALKLIDANNSVRGNSNNLNVAEFTGKLEQISINTPSTQAMQAVVNHTGGIGTNQEFFGRVLVSRAQVAPLTDVQNLSPQMQTDVRNSISSFVMLADGNRFRPLASVSRGELASALIRGGRVPQYLAGNPLFSDVSDLMTRGAVESAQNFPSGRLFVDVSNNGEFRPHHSATKLVAAIAFVKAANLQNLTSSATLPVTITDAAQIPNEWRGYVAVALQRGFLSLDGNSFASTRTLKRIELAQAMLKLSRLAVE